MSTRVATLPTHATETHQKIITKILSKSRIAIDDTKNKAKEEDFDPKIKQKIIVWFWKENRIGIKSETKFEKKMEDISHKIGSLEVRLKEENNSRDPFPIQQPGSGRRPSNCKAKKWLNLFILCDRIEKKNYCILGFSHRNGQNKRRATNENEIK